MHGTVRRISASLVFLLALLGSGARGSAEELFYKSNDFGMVLAPIRASMRHDSRWILEVQKTGPDEDRRLFDNGKETRRWQISWNRDRTQRVERESANGTLSARRVYDGTGTLLQEEEYTAGRLAKKTAYTYGNGRLTRKLEMGPDGMVTSTAVYMYAVNGGLREVRRTAGSDTTMVTSVVSGPTGLLEDRSSMGDALFVERYGLDGHMINRERRVDGETVSVEDFSYDAVSGVLVSSKENRPADGLLVERRYDDAGHLSQETMTVKGSVTETDSYEHDGKGREISRLRRSATGLETWKKSYNDAGDLVREEYSRRGILVKAIIHEPGKRRIEELYKDGELFLKVFYDGDTRLREEVWSNGAVLRQRSYQ